MSKSTHESFRTWYASALIVALVALPGAAVAQDRGDEDLALPNEESAEATDGAASYGLDQANAAREDGRGYGKGRADTAGGNSSSGGAGNAGGAGGAGGGGAR